MPCLVCKSKNIEKSWKVVSHQYYLCNTCGSLFLNPFPEIKTIKDTYDNFKYETGFINESKIRLRARDIIKNCLKLNSQAKNIVDIGCGAGFLLDEAKKTGLKAVGLEPSTKLAEFARKKYKLEVRSSYVGRRYSLFSGRKFDILILSHVLEHVENPQDFLKKAISYLSKNGILYIETPNYSGWLAEREKENYTFLTLPEHICLYSHKGLLTILQQFNNLTIERSPTYSEQEHVVGIFKPKSRPIIPDPPAGGFRDLFPNKSNTPLKLLKKLKYLLVHFLLAPLLLPLFNLGGKGSYLAFYIKKK